MNLKKTTSFGRDSEQSAAGESVNLLEENLDQRVANGLKRFADRSKDNVYQYDIATRRFRFFSKSGIEMYGSGKEGDQVITSKHVQLRIHPEDLEKVRKAARDSLAPGCSSGEVEYRFRDHDGSYRWMYDYWIVLRDSIGQPQIIEGIIRDNTKRKQAEAALEDSKKRLRLLSSHLLTAKERELRRISLELHDELGQSLTVLKLQLRSILKKLQQDQPQLQADFENTLKYVDQIIQKIRRLSHDLCPSILEDLGLTSALRWLIEDFAKHSHMEISMDIDEIDNLFEREQQVLIYRIFQEAFTNISKHAMASHVAVSVRRESRQIAFQMQDNGRGFEMKQREVRCQIDPGIGLTAMEERTRMLGGTLNVESRVGLGTRIAFCIPIDETGSR